MGGGLGGLGAPLLESYLLHPPPWLFAGVGLVEEAVKLGAAITRNGLSLVDLVSTELLRGLLSPFGHGLWIAILGGVLFSRSTREHFLLTGRLLAAYLGVSLLHAHALWAR